MASIHQRQFLYSAI
ncbi:hypothetical protein FWK35_00012936 [Aphis craccivora]|uniref:Uncharacterized protein n=1 Tax=Aphis craccivora TaxID=307492 RepID=A0A6G0ZDZ8_APHCR|nr:hypothetical protein FWK35_00012936 [Aphis craccivora]